MPVVIDSSALVELVVRSQREAAVAQAVGATDMVAPDVVNPRCSRRCGGWNGGGR